MRCALILLLFLCSSVGLYAQAEITATVVDTTGTTLPGANAILLRSSDTLLTSFGTTDAKGEFRMTKVPAGDYLLRVSFLGFERPDQPITVSESDQYLGLGELKLYPAGFLLENIEVTADRIPIRMKGDTMLYDAEAFAVGENAKVEDLLRRLPGMSIDANGQLTWRGRPVQEIMINGKPFFAGNATLVTQNLDAKALKNVEVYDQKSDAEEITGVDDGQENTTVNLEMKDDYKAKLFGELYAGAGAASNGDADPRYDAGGKVFRISDVTQLGILGTINNVNRVGFTGDELSSFNRSSGRGGGGWWNEGGLPYYDGGQTPGQNRSTATGINFGRSIGETGQLNLDYTVFDRQQTQSLTQREAFTRANTERQITSVQTDASGNFSHRLGFEFRDTRDTTSRLTVEGAGFLLGNDNRGLAATQIRNGDGEEDDYTVDETGEGRTPGGEIMAYYNRRLPGLSGRSFGFNANANYRDNQSDLEVLTQGLNEDPEAPPLFVGSLVNGLQFHDRRTTSFNFAGSGRYAEPLSKKLRLETSLGYALDEDEGDYRFRLDEQRTVNLLNRQWSSVTAGGGLVYQYTDRNSVQIGTDYQMADLSLAGDTTRNTRFNYLLPNFRLQINKNNKLYFRTWYNTDVQVPSISQLQTIARPSVTGRVTVGNAALQPALRHNLSTSLWFNDQFRAISANGYLSVGYTDNAFGNSLTFTSGQQIYQTINVSHAWNQNVYLGSTIGMEFIKGELRLGAQAYGSVGQGFVDGVARTNNTTNYSGEASVMTEFNEKSFLLAGYTYSRNVNSFEDEETVDIVTVTHDISTQFELEISDKWRFESRFLYRIFEAAAFAGQTNVPDLRASFELRPFRKGGHYFRISGEDLLNQNTVINRQAQAFRTSETISDGLGRYVLATFHYQL